MTESTFLNGRVFRQSLPTMRDPARAGGVNLKRLLLPQGELAQFHDADEPIHYLAFIELREGGIRGNHFHRVKEELIYVIQGELELVVEDITSRSRENVPLQTGDLARISTGVAHALRTVRPGQAIEFSQARFDRTDIHPYPLIGLQDAG